MDAARTPPGKPGVPTFVKFSQPRAACHKYSGVFIHSNSNPNFFFLRYSVHLCLGELGKIPQWCFLAKTLWLLKSEKKLFSTAVLSFPLWACEVRRSLLWQWDQTKRKLCSQPPPPPPPHGFKPLICPEWAPSTGLWHCSRQPSPVIRKQWTDSPLRQQPALYIRWDSRVISNSVFSLK